MKTPAFLTTACLAILLSGCASVSFTPYEGSQQAGAASAGAYVNRDYGLPIYQGAPPHPYYIIGKIEASERNMVPEGTDHAAVRIAKAKGANALIQLGKGSEFSGVQGGWTAAQTSPWSSGGSMWQSAQYLENAGYLAIRWAQ